MSCRLIRGGGGEKKKTVILSFEKEKRWSGGTASLRRCGNFERMGSPSELFSKTVILTYVE